MNKLNEAKYIYMTKTIVMRQSTSLGTNSGVLTKQNKTSNSNNDVMLLKIKSPLRVTVLVLNQLTGLVYLNVNVS